MGAVYVREFLKPIYLQRFRSQILSGIIIILQPEMIILLLPTELSWQTWCQETGDISSCHVIKYGWRIFQGGQCLYFNWYLEWHIGVCGTPMWSIRPFCVNPKFGNTFRDFLWITCHTKDITKMTSHGKCVCRHYYSLKTLLIDCLCYISCKHWGPIKSSGSQTCSNI